MNNMIKLNDFQLLWTQIEKEVIDSVKKFGKSGWYILGQGVKDFEQELTKFYPNNKYCTGCASGLDAIEIGLRALGIKPGDIVLTTPLSAFATTLAILRCGGIPAFVDTDENGLIDLNLARDFFTNNPNVKFFIPVHLYGQAINLEKLKKLKEDFDLKIVEDCAQAVLAEDESGFVGSVGQITATSFYPTKNLGCFGDGGALLTTDSNLHEISNTIRDYGQSSKYNHSIVGMNSRLDELQAIIMKDVFLPKLKKQTEHRRQIASIYINGIRNSEINLLQIPKNSKPVYHLFPVFSEHRDVLKEYLKQNEIESGIHYPILITDQTALHNIPHIISGSLDNAKKIVKQELSLPINSLITTEEANKVVKICNSWKTR
jgi:dTDP-3-amino-3,4,6-trideoxy-alpha-D-glucose transaminase